MLWQALILTTMGPILQVGAGKTYSAPCAAFAAASNGDTVEIDAATYTGDVCPVSKNGLTIRGVGGRPIIAAGGMISGKKGIWVVIGSNTTIENVEFRDAKVDPNDGANGAGIRQEGNGLTVRGCVFRHNENGILGGGGSASVVIIENSEFDDNGYGDAGYTHNLYIGNIGRLEFRGNWSHRLQGTLGDSGHLLKTRAAVNIIEYNRFDDLGGRSSRSIDVPNGGQTVILGNLILKGANSLNTYVIGYRGEGANANNPLTDVYVVNNTIVNLRGGSVELLDVQAGVTTPALVANNLMVSVGTVTNQAAAMVQNNVNTATGLTDQANVDFRLMAGSNAIDQGAAVSATGVTVVPAKQYVHPLSTQARPVSGVIDVGAYEFGAVVVADAGAATDSGVALRPDAGVSDAGVGQIIDDGFDGGIEPLTKPVGCGCSADGGSLAVAALLVLRKWAQPSATNKSPA